MASSARGACPDNLDNTAISDRCLDVLSRLPKLWTLNGKRTKVTRAGVARLFEKLPSVQIRADNWRKLPKRLHVQRADKE